MSKLKTLSVLGGVVAILALSATPASAFFKSTQSHGIATITIPGEFDYAGQGTFKCPASEIKAQWIIQGAGQIKQQQKPTTEGPHLNLQIKSWGPNCAAEIGTTKIAAGEIEIKECTFQLVQQPEKLSPTDGVVTPCTIKLGKAPATLCEIQIPAGMETSAGSGKGINVGLSTIALTNEEPNLLAKVNIESGGTGELAGESMFAQSVGKNAICMLKKSTEGEKLKGLELKLERVKAI